MIWTTRSHLHLDRTASAWLIRSFIDSDAQFNYIGWQDPFDASDQHAFGLPQTRFSGHDAQGTCFGKLLRHHRLDQDKALVQLERAIAAGVRHALELPTPQDQTEAEGQFGATLDAIGLGLSLQLDDPAHLDAASALYDALYTFFRLGDLSLLTLPKTQPERIAYLKYTLQIHSPA